MEYFLSIDQGTTSTRCILFNENGEIKLSHQVEIKQYFPDSNSVEHDGKEIIKTVEECIKAVVKNIDTNSIKSVGLTNQRETTIAWSKSTGEPFHNAIVWQDTRTQDICNELLANKKLKNHFEKTGLPVATYFSLSKILWLIRNVPSIKNGLDDDVCFGTIDSWIIYNLTGKFLTDVTNASRTLMFDIYDLDWSQGILKELGIPIDSLPKVMPSLSNFGDIIKIIPGVPITAVLGDQQAALFGQNCTTKGDVKNTYGTGCFALTNTGEEIIKSSHGLLTTIAYQVEGEKPLYALEGSVPIAGAAVQWLRDNLNIIIQSKDIESLAMMEKDNGGVYFVPAFSGLFSPYWDETARGSLFGLTRFSNKSHIARSVLESVAFQTFELIKSMEKDLDIEFENIKVDGGMVENNLLMQFQSDILNKSVMSQNINEITSLGVGVASYIYIKKLPIEEMGKYFSTEKTWSPNMNNDSRIKTLSLWYKAIERSKNWL
jgi:glycerol kinase|tara:strand:+ start:529 stop:1992 length:1464 start_codon:yes stop_codon:yes gene_type:complete